MSDNFIEVSKEDYDTISKALSEKDTWLYELCKKHHNNKNKHICFSNLQSILNIYEDKPAGGIFCNVLKTNYYFPEKAMDIIKNRISYENYMILKEIYNKYIRKNIMEEFYNKIKEYAIDKYKKEYVVATLFNSKEHYSYNDSNFLRINNIELYFYNDTISILIFTGNMKKAKVKVFTKEYGFVKQYAFNSSSLAQYSEKDIKYEDMSSDEFVNYINNLLNIINQ